MLGCMVGANHRLQHRLEKLKGSKKRCKDKTKANGAESVGPKCCSSSSCSSSYRDNWSLVGRGDLKAMWVGPKPMAPAHVVPNTTKDAHNAPTFVYPKESLTSDSIQ